MFIVAVFKLFVLQMCSRPKLHTQLTSVDNIMLLKLNLLLTALQLCHDRLQNNKILMKDNNLM